MKRFSLIILSFILLFIFTACDIEILLNEYTDLSTVKQEVFDGKLHVYYLDVDQADSIFIMLPNGKNMLIDAGTKSYGDDIAQFIKDKGVTEIDYLVATHPHVDHIGGMEEIVRSFEIENIYMPKASTNTKTFENLLLAIKENDYTVTQAKAGVEILSDDNLSAVFVAPNSDYYEELNNYSAVIKLTYGENSFVFTGDAEKLSEDEIRTNIKCDVLKVGHHGSSSSTSFNFLKKTEPTYAVISCGVDNEYGHPHKKVMERLEKSGITIYRTDLHGTIEAISDGHKILFNPEYDY